MNSAPFHADEREGQARAGQTAKGSGIRDFLPDQHRSFFELLPYLFIATTDANGWPLATMLTRQEGFVHSPAPTTLRVDAMPQALDPAAVTFARRQEIGILRLHLSTRRRDRANGHIADPDAAVFHVA